MTDPKRLSGTDFSTSWNEVFIIGGGPSARSFNFRNAPCRKILAINEAIFRLPAPWLLPSPLPGANDAASVFSLDSSWVHRRRDFLSKYPGEKYVAVILETFPECDNIPGVKYLTLGFGEGLSEDPDVIHGTNSGFGALNLCYLKGTHKIYLIGYDMNPDDIGEYESWRRQFMSIVPQLKAKGVEVLNLNSDSSIEAFPKVNAARV